LRPPIICMGTWRTFDVRGQEAGACARVIVDQALAAGAIFFDSSPMYGEVERVLGDALQGRRAAALIATKVSVRSLPSRYRTIPGSARLNALLIHWPRSWASASSSCAPSARGDCYAGGRSAEVRTGTSVCRAAVHTLIEHAGVRSGRDPAVPPRERPRCDL
jgi:diketogulonate reductase-like aldo/keto reductase